MPIRAPIQAQERWTFEQEATCSHAIRKSEDRLRALLVEAEPAQEYLNYRPSRAERTRGGAVERLKEAVEALKAEARSDASLRKLAGQADRAMTELEAHQWQLAMSARYVAHAEARRLRSPFLNFEDLAQEGYIGLLRAAQRFDPGRKIRFATYARWWVRAQIIRSIETKGRIVRLPGGAVEVIRKMRATRQQYAQAGLEISEEELASEVGLELERARELLQFEGGLHGQDVDIDDEDSPMQVADDGDLHDHRVERHQAFHKVMRAIEGRLDERERFILEQRFGLRGETDRTMADIGNDLGISRERVRQIQAEAIAFLRCVALEEAAA